MSGGVNFLDRHKAPNTNRGPDQPSELKVPIPQFSLNFGQRKNISVAIYEQFMRRLRLLEVAAFIWGSMGLPLTGVLRQSRGCIGAAAIPLVA